MVDGVHWRRARQWAVAAERTSGGVAKSKVKQGHRWRRGVVGGETDGGGGWWQGVRSQQQLRVLHTANGHVQRTRRGQRTAINVFSKMPHVETRGIMGRGPAWAKFYYYFKNYNN